MDIRQAFVSAKSALKKEEIKEWDITVYIRKWTAAERSAYLKNIISIDGQNVSIKGDMQEEMIRMLQITICDETGKRIFDDSQEDFDLLYSKEADIIERLFKAATDYNGIGDEAEKQAIKN